MYDDENFKIRIKKKKILCIEWIIFQKWQVRFSNYILEEKKENYLLLNSTVIGKNDKCYEG